MLTTNLALVSEVEGHDPSDVVVVAAALQKQATRDFGPIWGVHATVDAFPKLEDVPVGYWPMIIRDDIGQPGAAGIHPHKGPPAVRADHDERQLVAHRQPRDARDAGRPVRRPRDRRAV